MDKNLNINSYRLDLLKRNYDDLRVDIAFMLSKRFQDGAESVLSEFMYWYGKDNIRLESSLKGLGIHLSDVDMRILVLIKESEKLFDEAKKKLVEAMLTHVFIK